MHRNTLGFTTMTIVLIIVGVLITAGGVWCWQNWQAAAPSVAILSPNGGEKWEIGKSYGIEWTDNLSTLGKGTDGYTMVISLVQPGYGAKILFDNLASDITTENRVNWTIPKDTNPGSYIISITAYGNHGATIIDTGDAPFDIVATANTPQQQQPNSSRSSDEKIIRTLIDGFGAKLKDVSLLAPRDVVVKSIQENYAKFVSPELLSKWIQSPSAAPGRITSSPWPDRIEITKLTKIASSRYQIQGYEVEMTSMEVVTGGAAARQKINIIVEQRSNKWVIIDYMYMPLGYAP